MNDITIYRLPWGIDYSSQRENWYESRVMGFRFRSELEGEKAAEEAFHLTNAPDEILTEEQMALRGDFKGPSLSVGDIVQVTPVVVDFNSYSTKYYLCKSQGWEKFTGDTIQLLKHFSW